MKKDNVKKEYWGVIWIWAAICFMLTVFEPLSIYFVEKNEFWFDLYTMIPRCIVMFILSLGIGSLALSVCLFFLSRFSTLCTILNGCGLGLFAALYIQGNFMTRDLPVFSGGEIEWEEYKIQMWESHILWLSCILIGCVLAFFLIRKTILKKTLQYIGIAGILFFMLTIFMLGIQNKGFSRHLLATSTTKGLWDYSEDKNFVIFVFDAVDGDVQERVLNDYPEFQETLKDFTDYTNVLSGYPYTQWALPLVLSGDWYEYGEDFETYAARAYTQNELVKRLQEEGYRLDIYSDETPSRCDMSMYHNVSSENGSVRSNVGFCELWLRLVGFKYAPYSLKRYSQIQPWEFDELSTNTQEYPKVLFYDSNLYFYNDISNPSVAKNLVPEKCFKIIHIEGAHLPIWYHMDLSYERYVETSYYENVGACNTILKAYIEELKRLGVYDNTVLVVISDHGYNEIKGDVYYGRQHPMVFIKGLGERHDQLIYNDAPLSHEDFPKAYQKLLDGAQSDRLFDHTEGDIRKRRYLWCNEADATGFVEAFTMGHARETEALEDSGVRYP